MTIDTLQASLPLAGTLELRGRRGADEISWSLRLGDWNVRTAPHTDDPAFQKLLLLLADDPVSAHGEDSALDIEPFRQNVESGAPAVRAWVIARALTRAMKSEDVRLVSDLVARLDAIDDPELLSLAVGATLRETSEHATLADIQPLLVLAKRVDRDSGLTRIHRAMLLNRLASVYLERRLLNEADTVLQGLAEATQREEVPAYIAKSRFEHTGQLAWYRGRFRDAKESLGSAIALIEQMPGVSDRFLIDPLRLIGNVHSIEGDLQAAQQQYGAARHHAERVGDSIQLAKLLNNLGIVSSLRGEMGRSEYFYHQALEINEASNRSLGVTRNLFNLADIAYARRDFATSISLLGRVISTLETFSPDSAEYALAQTTLAHSKFELGALDEASEHYAKALALYRKIAPESHDVATVLIGIGDVALARGEVSDAIDNFEGAVALLEAISTENVRLAEAHQYLASAHRSAGSLDAAKRHLILARDIQETLATNSIAHAESLHQLAHVEVSLGNMAFAIECFEQAIAILEAQTERLGGADDSRVNFTERYSVYFKDYSTLLLDIGETERAFDVLERYRARSLLALLAERDQGLTLALPQALDEERRRVDADYKSARGTLVELSSGGASTADIKAAQELVAEAKLRRDGLTRRLRVEARDFADLRYPSPLTLAEVQRILDPDTVALAYGVGSDATHIFTLTSDSLNVTRVSVPADELTAAVTRMTQLLDAGRFDQELSVPLSDLAAQLYQDLIPDSVASLRGKRLLLIPDGPLHALPFAALVKRNGGVDSFLIEEHPLHQSLSFTLYAALRSAPFREQNSETLVAFGNPVVGAQPEADRYVPYALAAAQSLPPLPYSADEVRTIAGEHQGESRLFVGQEATEAAFRHQAGDADVIHIAAHAVVDERSPLDTALLLSAAGNGAADDDGLLQSWEIFEGLRLQASLVVLSACQSAVGRFTSSEGLLSLERAFQYAGAKVVLSTLWRIADRSSYELMLAFYRHRASGLSADVALQQAQLDLYHGRQPKGLLQRVQAFFGSTPTFRHPYHWAAFRLNGAIR